MSHPLLKSISRIGHIVLLQKPKHILSIGIAIFFLKTGIRGILPWSSFVPVNEFPKLQESFSTYSLGMLILARLFRANTEIRYFFLSLAILLLLSSIFLLLLKRNLRDNSLAVIIFLLCVYSPVGVVLAGNIGRHDVLTIFGFAFFFLQMENRTRYFGLLLGLFGSPEHFIVGWLFALITAICLHNKTYIRICRNALLSCVGMSTPIFAFVYLNTFSQNRVYNIFNEFGLMKIALRNSIYSLPLEFYSYVGVVAPIILLLFMYIFHSNRNTFIKLAFIFILPAVLNLIIVDKTRDYVIAMLASWIVFFKSELGTEKFMNYTGISKVHKDFLVGLFVFCAILFPSIEVTFEGTPRAPHSWAFDKVQEFCNFSSSFC